MDEDLLITESEWQAVLVSARILHQIGERFQAADCTWMAMECEAHAAALEDLARRAVVAAARGNDTPDADREAQR